MLVCYLYVLSGEVFDQIFYPFINLSCLFPYCWVLRVLHIIWIPFVWFVICKYFLPVCDLFFIFLTFFQRTEVRNFEKDHFALVPWHSADPHWPALLLLLISHSIVVEEDTLYETIFFNLLKPVLWSNREGFPVKVTITLKAEKRGSVNLVKVRRNRNNFHYSISLIRGWLASLFFLYLLPLLLLLILFLFLFLLPLSFPLPPLWAFIYLE